MSSDRFVSYLRPALSVQGATQTALVSQRAAIDRHLARRGRLAAECVEWGPDASDAERPALCEALALCGRHGATLLMAELGASGQDPGFLRALSRDLRRLDLHFAVADSPEVSEATLGIMAAVAEAEDRLGVRRTPETLARRRAFYARFTAERRAQAGRAGPSIADPRPLAESLGRGETLPRSRERAEEVAPILSEIRAAGALTLEQVANALNALGIPSARGSRWYPMQVTRIEKRLAGVG
ncbi:resolvase [Methylorubrum sp. Q1]|uniref:recombinase family protein n=1 Tax=Methylorubrum sp. Q1 TaxID=2562453 RepID=UPI0010768FE5|nr:recombinase family protein [Methylorubrum sp. Q1]TFZ56151.1 resolvase [Methylorubrum sp. Q1]